MRRSLKKNRAIRMLLAAMACYAVSAWNSAHAQNKVVVIPLTETVQLPYTGPPAPAPKTGQTTCWDVDGAEIDCNETGHDGDLQKGVAWPVPRFKANGDGTVTDNLTGLIWLEKGNCDKFYDADSSTTNERPWADAVTAANDLKSGYCGLSDGSKAGDWRLPNFNELNSLIDRGQFNPSFPVDAPTGFKNSTLTELHYYWTSTSDADPDFHYYAWVVDFYDGWADTHDKLDSGYVRAVRGGP